LKEADMSTTAWFDRWSHVALGVAYAPSVVLAPFIAPEMLRALTRPIDSYGLVAPAFAGYTLLSYLGVAVGLLLLLRARPLPGEPLGQRGRRVRWMLVGNWLPHVLAGSAWALLAGISRHGLV
jgi:hypothetical protein